MTSSAERTSAREKREQEKGEKGGMERERSSRLPPREVTDGLLRPLLEGGVVAKQPISILEQRLGRKGFPALQAD